MIGISQDPLCDGGPKQFFFSVVILPKAGENIEAIYSQMKSRSPVGAKNWARTFFTALFELQKKPRHTERIDDFDADVSELVFEFKHGYSLRILLLARDARVFVLHVGSYWDD